MPIVDLVGTAMRRHWAAEGLYDDLDLYRAFRQQADRRASQTAVVDAQRSTTYGELLGMTHRLANFLAELGVDDGQIVAVQLPNRAVSCATEYAIAALGAAVLPIPTRISESDLRSLLLRSRASTYVGFRGDDRWPSHLEALSRRRSDLPELVAIVSVDGGDHVSRADEALGGAASDHWTPRTVDPDGPVRVSVTSGTEAFPKLVVNSHNALGRPYERLWSGCGIDERSVVMLGPPLASGMGQIATSALLGRLGGTIIIMDAFVAGDALRMTTRNRPTHWWAVPTMVQLMLAHPTFAAADLSSLRGVIVAGSPVPESMVRDLDVEHGLRCVPLYGFVDGGLCSTRIDDPLEVRARTVGRPDSSVNDMRVVDEAGHSVPAGTAGEVLSRGPFSPMGYLNSPDLDERYRLPDGSVRSGDLGVLDEDGRLRIVGRVKDTIVRGGLNISPAEIEAVLTTHPDIVQAACVGYPDDLMGERVCAFLVLHPSSSTPDVAALGKFLMAHGMAKTKLPERIEVVSELPTNPAGKIMKRFLRARLVGPDRMASP